jgi:hypothetical protein
MCRVGVVADICVTTSIERDLHVTARGYPATLGAMEDGALRTQLRAELDTVIAGATQAAANAIDDRAGAVHAIRRALRRGRVILAMIAPALRKRDVRAMHEALGKARHALSPMHDVAVAPEIVERLALTDTDRMTARDAIENVLHVTSASSVRALLDDALAALAAVASAFPAEVAWDDVAAGVRALYRDARRAHGKDSRRWFLTWHRRTKELVHALEIIAKHGGPRLAAIHGEFAALTEVLRTPVDLVTLRELVKAAADRSPDVEKLREHLDDEADDLIKDVRKSARDAFNAKPKKFERRLDKARERDLTPADQATPAA